MGHRLLTPAGLAALARLSLLALLLLGSGCSGEKTERPSVLLITVDTLRADHLGAYGYRLDTSPRIDRLAAEGVRFADCSVQWPKTWPSMASFLTGLYPASSGLRLTPRRMPEGLVTLSDVFRDAGYRTGAVVANFNVGKTMGFEQGFEHFVESWEEGWRARAGDVEFRNAPGLVKRFTNAETVTNQGLAWLETVGTDEPFFLWLHYMDPHGPYLPPPEYRDVFAGEHPEEIVPLKLIPPYQRQLRAAGAEIVRDLGFYRAQYDRSIRYLDDELGRLFHQLEERGSAPLTVFGADHGESLGEHDYLLEHGRFSYQANTHTPLIFHWPGRIEPGVVETPVGMIDAGRTLLELAGLPVPAVSQGTSLGALLTADPGAEAAAGPRYVYIESGEDEAATQRSLRRGKWKLIEVRAPNDRRRMTGARFELYDLSADPQELRNLAGERPKLVAELGRELARWFAELPPPAVSPNAVDVDGLSAEDRQMLEILGYH